ncbi:MAG TPA: R3H domain-containing nucleic acid-binding protein [Candidatus Sumerlaeota bacterium]|nr:MAG: R3H domain protein [candidate division BRC1 bacterium ADurb.BinA292]HOE97772.1 R3H domain-containing nucleic acid-binding protein [Candidatus Sumerlaeota bacterium]HOR28082.1 R3H domain-containing nucleic acid-binding protein [Candidatus Sumerlaeota bacterium]HPK02640.1 R3H domain-containing nucleic acid-binding protein [Candidatus Sumerlaeota bacterium]
MSDIVVAGNDEAQMLEEALQRLGLPREAVDYHVTREKEEDLLPGATPLMQMHVSVKSEYVADKALDHLEAILSILDIEAELEDEIRNGIIFIHITSKQAASLLIGRDGQNLDALQHLITRMVMRVGRDSPLVVIDIEGYRMRQFAKLEKLGQLAMKRARETGNEIELDPMPPLERKYLHHYLKSEPGITTFSRGEEPERYLVIIAD